MKIYLAGPEVFFPDADELGARKKQICEQYGFTGLFPLDTQIEPAATASATGFLISHENEQLIQACDLVIANLTPFRGASADVGTVYEIGLARGLGKPIHGYTNDPELYHSRLNALFGSGTEQPQGQLRDRDGLKIEEFDLRDNLMIDGGIHACGGHFITAQKKAAITETAAFEELLIRLSR